MILSVIISRPTTSSRPSNPLSASLLAPQIRPWLTIVRVYKLYLLTYLLTYLFAAMQPAYIIHFDHSAWGPIHLFWKENISERLEITFFAGLMSFLPPNKWCQSTAWKVCAVQKTSNSLEKLLKWWKSNTVMMFVCSDQARHVRQQCAKNTANINDLYWCTNAVYSHAGTMESIAWWMFAWICWNWELAQFVSAAYSSNTRLLCHKNTHTITEIDQRTYPDEPG